MERTYYIAELFKLDYRYDVSELGREYNFLQN